MKTAKTWKAQLTILGIAAIVIVGVAMLVFPSVKGNLAGESSRIELTAYFYDPLSPNPASLLQAAIQDAKKPAVANASKVQSGDAKQPAVPATMAAPAGEFQARYDPDLSVLYVVVGADDEAKAKAAARAALDAIVAAYMALPARQSALTAYLAARDFGTIKLLGRTPGPTAAAEIQVATSILKEEKKKGSVSAAEISLAIGLAALTGLLSIITMRKQAKTGAIAIPARKPSAQ